MSTSHPSDVLKDLEVFAAKRIGPAALELVRDPARQAQILGRLRSGTPPPDALLGLIHGLAAQDRELAAEFVQFFFEDLHRLGHGQVRIGLQRFVETGDLVQSVVGDLWPQMFDLDFRGRDAFLALLASRVRWKARDRARGFDAGTRREDLRVPTTPPNADASRSLAWDTPDPHAGPATELISREEYEAMVLALQRLPERPRRLLRAHLAGEDWETIAAREDLKPESARKAVQRAMADARAWWASREGDHA